MITVIAILALSQPLDTIPSHISMLDSVLIKKEADIMKRIDSLKKEIYINKLYNDSLDVEIKKIRKKIEISELQKTK